MEWQPGAGATDLPESFTAPDGVVLFKVKGKNDLVLPARM
jgi:hypothetical protein